MPRVHAAPGKTRWIIYTFVIVTLLVAASYFTVRLILGPTASGTLAASSYVQEVTGAQRDSVLFIYPEFDKNRTKPAGVEYPSEQDSAFFQIAGGIIFGMTSNPQLSTTDSSKYVNLEDGRPQFGGSVVVIGNSQVNAVARYYENTGAAPLLLAQDKDSLVVQNGTGSALEPTRVSKKNLGSQDFEMFVVETFTDTEGPQVIVMWGYTGRGAISAARFVKFEIAAHPEQFTSAWYVGKWTDAREGGSKNGIPDQGDSYEILFRGESAASPGGTYAVGWTLIDALWLVALILMALGYSFRRGWITVEIERAA